MKNFRSFRRGSATRSFMFASAVAICGLAGSAAVYAQSTAGKVFGHAPAGATVTAQSMINGTKREVQVDADGRYSIRALPAGTYSVILSENGKPVAKHVKVPVIVGRGINVTFDCAKGGCGQPSAMAQQ